jgi:O-antigen/teichoic acid export membrane protein
MDVAKKLAPASKSTSEAKISASGAKSLKDEEEYRDIRQRGLKALQPRKWSFRAGSSALKRGLGRTWRHFMRDSLYRNSIYLILNSGLMAFIGFVFWLIAAHLYTTSDVGITTTLVSVTTVLLLFSYLGLNNSIVRFLPGEEKPRELIDSMLTTVTMAAIVTGIIFVVGVKHFVPTLAVLHNPLVGGLFVIYIALGALNTVTDNIFLAKREAGYTLLANIGLAICKIALPFALLAMGSAGLFTAHALGIAASAGLSLWFAAKFLHYTPKPRINTPQIKKIFRFSVANYVSNFMVSASPMLLPVIITNRLGTKESAYFYIAMNIANLIYIIPNVTTNAMFAESSHNEQALRTHALRSFKFILAIIIPMSLVVILGAKFLLGIFGHEYSVHSAYTLQIFAATAIFMTINYISATVLQVKLKMRALVTITTIGAAVIIGSAYYFAAHSLNNVAWAWLGGQALMSILFVGYLVTTMFNIPGHKLGKTSL